MLATLLQISEVFKWKCVENTKRGCQTIQRAASKKLQMTCSILIGRFVSIAAEEH